jgi:hypothetical protein
MNATPNLYLSCLLPHRFDGYLFRRIVKPLEMDVHFQGMDVAPTREYFYISHAIRGLKHVSKGCLTAVLVAECLGQPEFWRNGLTSTGTLPWAVA